MGEESVVSLVVDHDLTLFGESEETFSKMNFSMLERQVCARVSLVLIKSSSSITT